ncbi:MAG TPA: hypothetical protein PKD09_09230 [Aggregatilinea sp.]|uniref:hypothetical protein n=1 Tax=Aggregatilinea sp. TaxID=2806333 RepID=UPI002CE030FF|nr:hypothetical protein [Aggregatilinea sp.]HML21818.1 hypothetical protein [Aggregatilinea sp.]
MFVSLDTLRSSFRPVFDFAPDTGAGSGGSATNNNSGGTATGQNSGDGQQQNNGGTNTANTGQNANQQGNAGNTQQGGQQQNQQDANAVTMPRETFNERIAQERRAGTRELLTEMGFEGVETPEGLVQARTELRTLIDFAREQRRSQLSAEERVAEDLQAAQTAREQAETRATAMETRATTAEQQLQQYIRRTVILEAASDARYPEDVYTWALNNQADQVAAILVADQSLFENGTLNTAAINRDAAKAIVEECVKARRDWFRAKHPGVPSNAGAQPQQRPDVNSDKKTEAAAYTAHM